MHLRKVSPQYIIRGQFVGVNKPSRLNACRYHCAEGLALQCFSLCHCDIVSIFVICGVVCVRKRIIRVLKRVASLHMHV